MPIIANATQAMLDEARTAYHQLLTGQQPRVVVDVDGTRIEFTAVSQSRLAAYIQQLEIALSTAVVPNLGPLRATF